MQKNQKQINNYGFEKCFNSESFIFLITFFDLKSSYEKDLINKFVKNIKIMILRQHRQDLQ